MREFWKKSIFSHHDVPWLPKNNKNPSAGRVKFACNMYLPLEKLKQADLPHGILFLHLFLLCVGQKKMWSRVLFIFTLSPQGPHLALEMSVGSLLWRGALTFPPHPHWQPMCQLVAFSAGVGVWEVENTEERETEEKERESERVYERFWMCVCVYVTRPQTSDIPFAMT